jgi:DnaK suppressor protein
VKTIRGRTRERAPSYLRERHRALTPAQRRDLERELLAERARLERALGALQETDDAAPRRADYAAGPGGDPVGALRIALHGRAPDRLDAIDAALQRLADGTYGRCARCGEHIPFGRLLVVPESEHCVTCGGIA